MTHGFVCPLAKQAVAITQDMRWKCNENGICVNMAEVHGQPQRTLCCGIQGTFPWQKCHALKCFHDVTILVRVSENHDNHPPLLRRICSRHTVIEFL